MTALGLLMMAAGTVLIASGVKDYDPRDVMVAIFTGKPMPTKGSGATPRAQPTPGTNGQTGTTGGSSGGGTGGGGGSSWPAPDKPR